MAVDLPLINGTWQALQPSLREAKCIGCECLQGALVELRMAASRSTASSRHARSPQRARAGKAERRNPQSARRQAWPPSSR
jgi:hypothetical protein